MPTYYGDENANYIVGSSSSDTIYGYGNADYLLGMNGNDFIYGGEGYDTINGGRGNDTLYGEGGYDVFEIGGSGSGGAGGLNNGWDSINGGDGIDSIHILPTSGYTWTALMLTHIEQVEEIVNQGTAPSYIYINGNIDFTDVTTITNIAYIQGSSGVDTFTGGVLGERLFAGVGNDALYGNGGNDELHGDGGNDTIYGGIGDDSIYGDAGNDLLDGGDGYNSLTGGIGADKFQVSSTQDHSTVTLFSSSDGDKIQFTSDIATDFSQLTIADAGGVAHVYVGDVDITLSNITASSLSSTDFLFVA